MLRFATIPILLLALAASAPAVAGDEVVRCKPAPKVEPIRPGDAPATLPGLDRGAAGPDQTCQSSEGRVIAPQRTDQGAPVVRDREGTTLPGLTDSTGTTTFRSELPPPPSLTATPNGVGGNIVTDQNGRIYYPTPDGTAGGSTVRTDDGRTIRCQTLAGATTCN